MLRLAAILIAVALLAQCGAGPLVTGAELEDTVRALDERMDSSGQWILDAIINLLRSMFPNVQIQGIALEKQPSTVAAVHDELDWEIILAALAALGGTGGAVALRALDHRKKAKANRA